ncbi:SDR family oxidoreductase [Biostraticola tofi]|uniref:NAD(P)-dependent dehydrogenase (Short-subunit alcohol dehydrogenase family) n=1 Tax=Biostraticola tofi TaxID=466109 RepID=A0A4R3Z4H2_9GAMM|nr:SDR family oxidoreductase [Biostraticola tofi]TCV98869.1 NAD(P)-dependent dehydrogenase (short-subunit alcohol dehydrogenase family) [Biostraticola tofi]
MDLELENKVVIVTGGSKGIGLAVVRQFLQEGARVAIISRSEENLRAARDSLQQSEHRLVTHAADLRDAQQAREAIDRVAERLGEIDILVNSAGNAQRRPAEQLDSEAWHAAMDAKYFTYIHAQDAVLARWRNKQPDAAGQRGAIVNIVGTGGRVPNPSHAAGGAANAALLLSTLALATHYARDGIRLNAINPGFTNTERINRSVEHEAKRLQLTAEEALAKMEAELPLGRFGEPEEIADAVLFLASRRASYIAGAILTVDGAQKAIL